MKRTILLFVFVAGLRGAPPAKPGSVSFAQLTDPHIFDDGYRQSIPNAMRQAANDREALNWAVDQVNRAVASGAAIDFVVFTGDLGLQNVAMPSGGSCQALPFDPDPGLPQSTLAGAVQEIADELNQLAVRKVFFVPGNNDIRDENVTDQRFECFMAELKSKLSTAPQPPEVAALRAGVPIEINGIRIAGLNTASFKNQANYAKACAASTPALDLACPKPQMDALARIADGTMPVLLFTHVPDLIDPYRRKPSWDIPSDARSAWEREVCGPNIIGVFAGHFHDSNTNDYGSTDGSKSLASTPCVAAKTWVAPPLAMKNQERTVARARGFVIGTIEGGKVAKVQVNWFDSTLAPSIQDLSH